MRQRHTAGLKRIIGVLAICAAVALPQAALAGAVAHGPATQVEFIDLSEPPQLRARIGAALSEPHIVARSGVVRRLATTTGLSAVSAAQDTCDTLTASAPASWFATDAEGNVDTETTVQEYPAETVVIAPGFTYECAPEDTEIVVIIYNQAYGSDPALVDKRTLDASEEPGVFYYALTTPDGSPLQEGVWRVAFYEDKRVLSSGEALLGGAASLDVTTQAILQGSVSDLRTGQPVWQARVFVLKPGVSLEAFARDTRREDIYVQTRTDGQGRFSMWKPLERNTQYAMLIAADGYKLRGTDRLIIGDKAVSPVNLDIKLVKR